MANPNSRIASAPRIDRGLTCSFRETSSGAGAGVRGLVSRAPAVLASGRHTCVWQAEGVRT